MTLPGRTPATERTPSLGDALRASTWHARPLSSSTDASIRAAIGRARHLAPTGRVPARRRPPVLARAAAIAAVCGLAVLLSFLIPPRPVAVDSRLADAARLVESASDHRSALRDPALRSLLGALVAMPPRAAAHRDGDGAFALIDIEWTWDGPAPLAWMIEIEVPGLIAGVEQGDPPFGELPAYDPAALESGVVRLAGATEGTAPDVGEGRNVRVASVTVWRTGSELPRVTIAQGVGPGGESLALSVTCAERAKDGPER